MKHAIAKILSKTPLLYKAYDKIVPRATVSFKNAMLTLETPNTMMKARVDTFFTKEPQTLSWIDQFSEDDTLLDVGSNIGLYALYAAKVRGIKQVIAIEPESQNYAQLNRHIFLNSAQKNLHAYNFALSDKSECTVLNLSRFANGDSHHQVGHNLQHSHSIFSQGIFAITLDELTRDLRFVPTHIKIDVDGHEVAILKGAHNVLQDKSLKSILIEAETHEQTTEYSKLLKDYGFSVSEMHILPNTENGHNIVYTRN